MLTLDNFESVINAQILQRGRDYFKNQAVAFLEEDPPGTWTATVEGTDDYAVDIILNGKKVTEQSCDCPYEDGPVCKHVVAVLYALRERMAEPVTSPPKNKKLTFEDILLKTNLEELRQFIRQYKQIDRDFGEKFTLFFAEKDPNMDLSGKYEGIVRQIVRHNSSRGFMDYRQSFSFSKEIRKIFLTAETAISRKNYGDAFAIGKVICNELMQLIQVSDDSAGNIGEVLSSGIEILRKIAIADAVSPELLDELLDFLEKALADKVWFDFGDYGYELLEVVEETALKTDPQRYLTVLDELAKIHVGDYSAYKQEHFKTSKIRFYQETGRMDEAEKLISANMEIVEIRMKEVQKAIQKKDFAKAKQLILEGIQIAEGKKHPGTVSRWEEVLLEIARSEKDISTERYFARKFALEGGINIKYYQAWKATYPPSEWTTVIEQFIQSVIAEEKAKPRKSAWDNLEHSLYHRLAPVFIQEAQWARLLQLVSNVPSESALATVHPYLAPQYPKEILALYMGVLKNLGEKSSNRKEYEHLVTLMNKVKQDVEGSSNAINDLAAKLMQRYPRRPAMLEELRKIVRR